MHTRAHHQAAPASASRRQALLDALSDSGVAVALLDADGRYSWWSDDCTRIFGWTAEQMVGRSPLRVVDGGPEAVPIVDAVERMNRDGRWHGDLGLCAADGHSRAMETFSVPLRDEHGAIEGYLTGAVDPEAEPPDQLGLVASVLVRSDDAVLLCDGHLDQRGPTIVYANQAGCDLFGMRLIELVGRPAMELVHSGMPSARADAIAGQLRQGRRVREELRISHADGRVLVVEIDIAPFGAIGETVGQVVLTVHDITERRAAEAAHEERLGIVADLAGVGTWEVNLRTNETVWDDRMRQLLGVGPDVVADAGLWHDLIVEVDRAAADAARDAMGRDGDTVEGNHRIVLPDGTTRRILARGQIVERDADGPVRLMGVGIDVTESHAALDRVVATLEAMNEGYYALDDGWCFTYVNRHAEVLLGRSREELVARDARQEFPNAVGTVIERSYARGMVGEQVEFEAYFEPHDRWYEFRVYPQADGISVHFRDIGARRAAAAEREALLVAERAARSELAHAVAHDHLTGLPNRVALERWLTDTLGLPRRHGAVAVLYCDVDRFKVINDSLGHAAGDELLVAAAARLAADVRPGDIVARVGGDEFVVALGDACADHAERVAERLLDAFREPFALADRRLVVSASIGIAVSGEGATAETLLRDADSALYVAKDRGRDQVACFDEDVRTGVVSRLQVEHELRDALAGDELVLHYQPAFDLRTGRALGAEALLRWNHPSRGLLSAGAFIDVAEDTGMIAAVGDWVLPATGRDRGRAPVLDELTVWVNVSVRQLVRPGFADHLLGLVAASGATPAQIGVEVTESALADDNSVPLRELQRLADAGVRIAIDDFGTGYSSVARLRRYPVHVLKLDRAFVDDLDTPEGRAVVAAVIDLAHAVGAVALAEGVETAEQLAALRTLGCDAASGYHLARPVPAGELAAAIEAAPR